MKYQAVIIFTAYGRILKKYFQEDVIHMAYVYKRRIKRICNTAVIHSMEWYEIKLINKVKVTDGSYMKTHLIHEEDL